MQPQHLTRRHLKGGHLVLYDITSVCVDGARVGKVLAKYKEQVHPMVDQC